MHIACLCSGTSHHWSLFIVSQRKVIKLAPLSSLPSLLHLLETLSLQPSVCCPFLLFLMELFNLCPVLHDQMFVVAHNYSGKSWVTHIWQHCAWKQHNYCLPWISLLHLFNASSQIHFCITGLGFFVFSHSHVGVLVVWAWIAQSVQWLYYSLNYRGIVDWFLVRTTVLSCL